MTSSNSRAPSCCTRARSGGDIGVEVAGAVVGARDMHAVEPGLAQGRQHVVEHLPGERVPARRVEHAGQAASWRAPWFSSGRRP